MCYNNDYISLYIFATASFPECREIIFNKLQAEINCTTRASIILHTAIVPNSFIYKSQRCCVLLIIYLTA